MIRVADSRADLERCVEICNAVGPDNPVQVDQFSLDRGVTLMHDGGGYAFVVESSVAASAYTMVRVHPEARRRGVGTALLQAARERTRALGRESLWGRVHDEESLEFVARRGFEEVTREVNVLRDLRPGDGEVAPGMVEVREEHLREVYELCAECIPEIHVPLRGEVPPYDEWRERETERSPIAFAAADGGRLVGYARLYETGLPHRLEHGLTVVRRSHRRRGIAAALKRTEIAWAAEHGYTELVSDMVEGNAPMRALNERLGYRALSPVIIVSGSASW
jgi:mycothiol synthase